MTLFRSGASSRASRRHMTSHTNASLTPRDAMTGKYAALGLLLVTLTGCATPQPPIRVSIEKSRVYAMPYDKVWAAIIAGVAESNLPITTLEKDSGLIAIANATYEPEWANEGVRGSVLGTDDKVMERLANFNIFAVAEDPANTRVQVNSDFRMNVRRGNGSDAVPFSYQWQSAFSNGALERLIFDGIARRAAH